MTSNPNLGRPLALRALRAARASYAAHLKEIDVFSIAEKAAEIALDDFGIPRTSSLREQIMRAVRLCPRPGAQNVIDEM